MPLRLSPHHPLDGVNEHAFHPDISRPRNIGPFPAGVRCTYWVGDDPELVVSPLSEWPITLLFDGLVAFALFQSVRVTRPDIGGGQPPGPS